MKVLQFLFVSSYLNNLLFQVLVVLSSQTFLNGRKVNSQAYVLQFDPRPFLRAIIAVLRNQSAFQKNKEIKNMLRTF